MSSSCAYIRFSAILILSLVSILATSAAGQVPSDINKVPFANPDDRDKAVAKSQLPKLDVVVAQPVTKSTPDPNDLQGEVESMKAENAAVREMLRKMEEQQKVLLEQVERLQRRLDGSVTAAVPVVAPDAVADASAVVEDSDTTNPAFVPKPALPDRVAKAVKADPPERYHDGIIIWMTPDEAKVPFLLRLNAVTQVRYLNTLDSDNEFTDHLGVVRDVHNRNDITINRTMFMLNGYIYSKKLQYSLMVWTAAGAASIIVTGSIGWQFNKHLTLTGGYMGIPGSRSLTNTFPYFTSSDRTMADNFFRPGFTQGVMASGEITKNLYYNAFVGNSLNTLSITANKIDTNLMGAGSVWWEPLGAYSEPGRSVNMYDDYFAQKKWRIRLGTSFTISREDRFSNLDQSSPENSGIYNSDGVNAFQTGAFAIGVTVQNATYKMWASDWGLKYNGLAINGQYYVRTLTDFDADGPLPLTSTLDHGYEMSVGKFVIPRKLMVYARGSGIWGEFKNPYEYGAGVKWHFLPTERLWVMAELMKVKGAAYSGAFSPYTSGMNGWIPMVSSVLAF